MDQELKTKIVLKDLMKTRGETLKSISTRTGVPKSTISDWLADRTPNPLQAAKIAKYFGVSLHFFLFGTRDPLEPIENPSTTDMLSGIFEISVKRILSGKMDER